MHLGQIRKDGAIVAAIFQDLPPEDLKPGDLEPEGGLQQEISVRPIPAHTMLDLIERSEAETIPLPELAAQLASRQTERATPIIPIYPIEVWGCGCTYETSATFRDGEQGTREGMYAHVYREERPEIFFKGTARVCVGPAQSIGLRKDARFTAPEPELALVLGSRGSILGYTIANDVSAWDIERENPLYLPQSKQYNACCALGPVIVTADAISHPYALEIRCTVRRGETQRYFGSTSTGKLHRRFEQMVEFLLRSNAVPAGSVLLTGTGIIVTEEAALEEGDLVEIEIPQIGILRNIAARV